MPLSFPSSPTVGQVSTQNGRSYTYAGNNVWELTPASGGDDARWDFFKPPAPTGLTATAGNAQVILAWAAPTVSAQTPITDYLVQFSTNSGSSWTTFSDGTSTATSATVTGLTNGTPYVFRVAGINGIGQGAWSDASDAVTPVDGDQFFSSVSLLLHADGNFTDSSSSPKTVISRSGYPTVLANGSPRFGSASFTLSGNGDAVQATHTSFNRAGSAAFTCELWFKRATDSMGGLFAAEGFYGSQWDGRQFRVSVDSSGIRWSQFTGGPNSFQFGVLGGTVTVGQWHHLAACREDGGPVRVFLNGTLLGSVEAAVLGTSSGSGNADLLIGDGFHGEIDEVRWSTVNRHTGSTAAVPTAAYPDA